LPCAQENALLRESIARFQLDTSTKLAHMAALLRSAAADSSVSQLAKGSDAQAATREHRAAATSPLVHQSHSLGSLGSSSVNLAIANTSTGHVSSPTRVIGQHGENTLANEAIAASGSTGSLISSGSNGNAGIEADTTRQLRADLVATRAALEQYHAVVRRASARIAALEAENQRCVEQLVQEREIRAKQARLIERLTGERATGGERHSGATSNVANVTASASASASVAASHKNA
jgi:hypothetical protein